MENSKRIYFRDLIQFYIEINFQYLFEEAKLENKCRK